MVESLVPEGNYPLTEGKKQDKINRTNTKGEMK